MNSELSDFQNALRTAMQENWKWFVFQGIVMLVLGCLAVAEPVIASVAVDIYIGWLFMFGGVLGLVAMFSARDASAFFWMLLTAALSLGDRFPHGGTDGVLYRRRRIPDRSVALLSRYHARFLGLAARERNLGSRSSRAHHLLLAGECKLDARPYRGNQYDHDRTSNPYDCD